MAYEIIEGTACVGCIHRVSRTMEPFDLEELGFAAEELDLDETEGLILEQHICILIGSDIDGRVLDCNGFKKKRPESLLKTDIFKH